MNPECTRSLFVVALPRSLSSIIYQALVKCTGLKEPIWTSDGEILNADRFVLLPGPNEHLSRKFTLERSEGAVFRKITEFLDQVTSPHGFAYKDVVQPFVVGEWIKRHRPPTIKVRRQLTDVAYSMLEHGWLYPNRLFPKAASAELGLVQGLIRAQSSLDSAPGVEVDFDELVSDERVLDAALARAYGEDQDIRPARYIDRHFRRRREEIVRRRATARYRAVQDLVERAGEP